MVAHTRAQLSCALTEDEAVTIANRTELFGYQPEIVRHPDRGIRLTMFSDADARRVEVLRDGMRDCDAGLHSWIDAVGKLPPDTACTRCGDLYGYPD